jgi:hypothetical protein
MPEHEEFEELCALAASGQISAADWKTLQGHLQSCLSCGATLGDFGGIGADLTAEFATSVPPGHIAEMRSRFLERARKGGGKLSAYPVPSSVKTEWKVPSVVLSGCIAATILLLLGGAFLKTRMEAPTTKTEGAASIIVQTQDGPANLSTPVHSGEDLPASTKALEQERDALEAKLDAAKAREAELETRVTEFKTQLDAEGQLVAAAQSNRQATALRLAQIQDALDEARSKQVAEEVRLASAQGEIDNLNQQVLYEQANSEREKALLATGENGKNIIAARNLHIIDVYDADGRGKRRSFGRVFYVEGQELVFYAYDLSDPRHASVQFYAWGAGGIPGDTVTRLGILHYDGQNEQRWVLKYNDGRALSKMDSIFVTAETVSDPEKPKGRRVLFAVLSGQPNHP